MMIHADLDKILPEPDALEQISQIFHEVENYKELYVITKGGRPALAVINIDYLEELIGKPVSKDIPEETISQKETEEKVETKEIGGELAEEPVVEKTDETPLIEEEEESTPPSTPPSIPPVESMNAPANPNQQPVKSDSFSMPPSGPKPPIDIKPELMTDLSPNPTIPALQPVPSGNLSQTPDSSQPPTVSTTPPANPNPAVPTPPDVPENIDSGEEDTANSSPLL